MLLERLAALVRDALVDAGVHEASLGSARFARPVRPAHGDFGTPAALRFARVLRRSSLDLADELATRLEASPYVEQAHVAAPGFVNVRLTPPALADIALETLAIEDAPTQVPPSPIPSDRRTEDLISAYGRVTDVARWAGSFGMKPSAQAPAILAAPPERALVCALAELGELLRSGRETRVLLGRLVDVADLLWRSGVDYRVLPSGDEEPTPEQRTRLLLVDATRAALAAGLAALD